ncbi:MAG: hypothetical protein NVS9B4_21240 [Candidatus Acidiferrum sp.]
MDFGTHTLASLALVRAGWPRAPRVAWMLAVAAGVAADADALSAWFGPAAYFAWRRTYFHSLVFAVVVAVAAACVYVAITSRRSTSKTPGDFSWRTVSVLALFAASLHVAMDACQWRGAVVLWPFRSRVVAADLLGSIDPWIIAILVACLALPELLHLVNTEIGFREKRPRGQIAAIAGFALIFAYVGGRAVLHANALAKLRPRTYYGELPQGMAALPENASLTSWHGIVGTPRSVDWLNVSVGPSAAINSEDATRQFKPEQSTILDAGQNTATARRFLSRARFPNANVEKISSGYEVQIRDLIYVAAGETSGEVGVQVELDENGKVISDEFVWANSAGGH